MVPAMMKRLVMAMLTAALMLGAAACKKKSEQAGAGSGSGSAAADAGNLAVGPEPEGLSWKRIEVPFGSLELPQNAGWGLVGSSEIHGPDGVVIVMQAQDEVGPERFDKYRTAFIAVQKRDAPKYEVKSSLRGTVNGELAARVDGTFDNGTRFITRDFLVFTKGKVVLVGARIPEPHAATLPALIDYVARSLQVK